MALGYLPFFRQETPEKNQKIPHVSPPRKWSMARGKPYKNSRIKESYKSVGVPKRKRPGFPSLLRTNFAL
jgi:hypothetical protein